jgi:hypothetical protein
LTFDDRNGRDPATSRRQHFRGWWRCFAGVNHHSSILHAQMRLVLPRGVTLDFCEGLSGKRLYPPAALTSGIQHELLSWANASRPPLNGIHLIWTAYIRHGNFGEFDSSLRGGMLARVEKKEGEKEKNN